MTGETGMGGAETLQEGAENLVPRCLVCVAVCCGVQQCVAVCCIVLECVTILEVYREARALFQGVCCSVLQCIAVCCNMLQCVAVSHDWRCRCSESLVPRIVC